MEIIQEIIQGIIREIIQEIINGNNTRNNTKHITRNNTRNNTSNNTSNNTRNNTRNPIVTSKAQSWRICYVWCCPQWTSSVCSISSWTGGLLWLQWVELNTSHHLPGARSDYICGSVAGCLVIIFDLIFLCPFLFIRARGRKNRA